MQLTKYRSGNFVVFRVEELIHTTTSIAELRTQIEKTVRTECVNIAVRFCDDAMLRSSAVADLVLSAGLVHSRGGTFALIDPSETICRTLRALGVTNLITIVDNEHELDGQGSFLSRSV
jgi:anti-anti-sigma regulatory factor